MRIIGGTHTIPGTVGQLCQLFGVQLRKADGTPEKDVPVTLEIPNGGGEFTNGRPAITVRTDENGEAWAQCRAFREGTHTIVANAGPSRNATFNLVVVPAPVRDEQNGDIDLSYPVSGRHFPLWPVAVMVIGLLTAGVLGLLIMRVTGPSSNAPTPTVIHVPTPTPASTTAHDPAARQAIGQIERDVDSFKKETEDALEHKPDRHEVEAADREYFRHVHRESYDGLNGLARLAAVSKRRGSTAYRKLCHSHPDLPACAD